MKPIRFLREFFRYPAQVGTVAQSTRFLAKSMAEEINSSRHIIEFGPGTGPVTKEILNHLPASGTVTCFEVNSDFCKTLERIGDPRLRIINDDARNCRKYVDELKCIVSGLPLVLFEESVITEILDITAQAEHYIQLQYSTLLKKKIKRYFSDVKIKFVPLNVPPAFVYVCHH